MSEVRCSLQCSTLGTVWKFEYMRVGSSVVERPVEAGQAGGSTPSQPVPDDPDAWEDDHWDYKCEWRIESTRNGTNWTPLYDSVSHHPYPMSSLTWCIEKVADVLRKQKFRERRAVRIRNLLTNDCIPIEALGL